jgi:choline dehydrogenase-like flavoprotein
VGPALAGPEWSFARLVEYFKRIESSKVLAKPTREPTVRCISRGSVVRADRPRPGSKRRRSGYFIDRPNKPEPQGFSETVVTQRHGARLSTADAYLRPALRRKNLKLITEATATRVVFDGPRAVEVEFEKDGERRVVRARREVVLSAGAVNSP